MGRSRLAYCLVAVVLVAGLAAGCAGTRARPVVIGVMLPLTGAEAVAAEGPLRWAEDNVNAAGGIDGRPVRFTFRDPGRRNVRAVALSVALDPSVAAVIGPDNSRDVKRVASVFFYLHKVLVTPAATSADLFRAFAARRRSTCGARPESDIAQVRVLLQLAAQGGAKSVALVTGVSPYGNTFFNSFGFLATEKRLTVTATIRYDQQAQDCQGPMGQALGSGAAVVLAVPEQASQAICMARQWRARGSRPRLLLSDAAQVPALISAPGPEAQGLEGTGLAPAPGNGFARAFQARSGQPPSPYAANLYDSVLLIAYGLARSGDRTGAALAQAIRAVVAGTGPPAGWDRAGVAAALAALRVGQLPAVHGAVGPWDFDKTSGLELVASTYQHWRIAGSRFTAAGYISTATAPNGRTGPVGVQHPGDPGQGRR